jgi:hypothetical protein
MTNTKNIPRKSRTRKTRTSPRNKASRRYITRKSVLDGTKDPSKLSFLPIALCKKEIKEFNLENRIDFLEYYHTCYNPHFLYPIDTTKMFTIKFKDNLDIDAFEMIYDKIQEEFPTIDLYQLQIRDMDFKDLEQLTFIKDGKYWHKLSEYDSGSYKEIKDSKLYNVNKTKIFFIENRSSVNFGHYGIIFYDGHNKHYSYFDSMLIYNNMDNNVTSPYVPKFINSFQYYFKDQLTIYIDEMNEYKKCSHSCLEVTGGEIRLRNRYTNHLLEKGKIINDNYVNFYTNQTIMGVDSQNQYCYMWGFAYVFAKLCSSSGWTKLFEKITCEKSIIPVCFIKYFSSFIINWLRDSRYLKKERNNAYNSLVKNSLFYNFYNSFISNSNIYRECFNVDNDIFNLYTNSRGVQVFNTKKKLSIKDIVNELYIFCDDYYNSVEIQPMTHENKKFSLTDCDKKSLDYNLFMPRFTPKLIGAPPGMTDFVSYNNHIYKKYYKGATTDSLIVKKVLNCIENDLLKNEFKYFMIYNLYTYVLDNSPHINYVLSILCDDTDLNYKFVI